MARQLSVDVAVAAIDPPSSITIEIRNLCLFGASAAKPLKGYCVVRDNSNCVDESKWRIATVRSMISALKNENRK